MPTIRFNAKVYYAPPPRTVLTLCSGIRRDALPVHIPQWRACSSAWDEGAAARGSEQELRLLSADFSRQASKCIISCAIDPRRQLENPLLEVENPRPAMLFDLQSIQTIYKPLIPSIPKQQYTRLLHDTLEYNTSQDDSIYKGGV